MSTSKSKSTNRQENLTQLWAAVDGIVARGGFV